MDSVTLQVKDFIIDEKRIKRTSIAENSTVETSFEFNLIKTIDDSDEINALFKATLEVQILDKNKPSEDNKVVEIFVELQIATFITNIEKVNFEDPTEEQDQLALDSLYPIVRGCVSDDLAYIKRSYSDLPFLLMQE